MRTWKPTAEDRSRYNAKYNRSPKGKATIAAWGRLHRKSANAKFRNANLGPIAATKAVGRLMQRYGLTRQQAEVALVSQQGDFCQSCRRFKRLVVDHDHVTGRARGMVCHRCNHIAGALEDPCRFAVEAYLVQ